MNEVADVLAQLQGSMPAREHELEPASDYMPRHRDVGELLGAKLLSRIYPSPWIDGGYDVTDHGSVHPALGTEEKTATLIEKAHERDLNVMLDQV